MKFKILFPLLIIVSIIIIYNTLQPSIHPTSIDQKPTNNIKNTEIKWREKHHNFEKLNKGEQISHYFYLKNVGSSPLIIKDIDSGCSCTQVNYSKQPILPQQEIKIEIIFDSKGQNGKQYKEIIIFANIKEGQTKISFTAEVN